MSVRALGAAFSYFTILPTVDRECVPPSAAAFAYLPVVGIAIGGIAGFAAYGLGALGLPSLAVAAAFALPIALSGALHVDGFLDACDALFAAVTPQQRLAIMKDPHHGTFAIAYFAVACVVWLAALAALPWHVFPAALAYAAGTARWAAALNLRVFPHRDAGRTTPIALAIGAVLVVAVSFALGRWAWIALPLAAILALLMGRWASRRLDGSLTGDVHGAIIVVMEIATLVACAMPGAR